MRRDCLFGSAVEGGVWRKGVGGVGPAVAVPAKKCRPDRAVASTSPINESTKDKLIDFQKVELPVTFVPDEWMTSLDSLADDLRVDCFRAPRRAPLLSNCPVYAVALGSGSESDGLKVPRFVTFLDLTGAILQSSEQD